VQTVPLPSAACHGEVRVSERRRVQSAIRNFTRRRRAAIRNRSNPFPINHLRPLPPFWTPILESPQHCWGISSFWGLSSIPFDFAESCAILLLEFRGRSPPAARRSELPLWHGPFSVVGDTSWAGSRRGAGVGLVRRSPGAPGAKGRPNQVLDSGRMRIPS